MKFANHVQNTVSKNVNITESANTNVIFQEQAAAEDRVSYKVRWNEDADEKMRQALVESGIDELNNLSSVCLANRLIRYLQRKNAFVI